MRKIIAVAVVNFVVLSVFAQQDAQFSMNYFNRLAINPAYAGMNGALCTTVLYRNQWLGFSGAPQTGLVSVDYGRVLGGGVGLTIDQDQAGFLKFTSAKIAYSYHKVLNVGTLGMGLDAGFIQSSISGNFVAPNGLTNDALIPWGGANGKNIYDIGAGLYYKTRKLYVGLSTSHLPQEQISAGGILPTGSVNLGGSTNWTYNFQEARNYYLMVGYSFFPSQQWEITPNLFVKSVVAATQVDASVMAKYKLSNGGLFGGTSFRPGDAVVAIVGWEQKLDKRLSYKAGFSYDFPVSNINSSSLEFMLNFCYKIVPDRKSASHMNVRFL